MAIPMAYLQTLSEAINRVSGAGQSAALAILTRLAGTGDYDDPSDLVEDALGELEPLFEAVAERCASLSATSYDILRTSATGEAMGARPYPDRDPEWTRRALHAIAAESADMDSFIRNAAARIDYEAKRAAGSTMFSNGVDDSSRPRFARVPTGSETCPFCIMLASRGFVYASERSAGKLDHYHQNCDCRVTPQWGRESYEGYDPDEYLRQYEQLVDDGKLDPDKLSEAAAMAKRRRAAGSRRSEEAFYREDPEAIVARDEEIHRERNVAWSEYRSVRRNKEDAEAYQRTFGEFVRGLSSVGRIDVQDFANPSGSELQLAQWLSRSGRDVLFIKAEDTKGSKTPDMYIDGQKWEIKQPTTPNVKKVKRRISHGLEQSRRILVDLSRSRLSGDGVLDELREMLADPNLEGLMVVMDGELIEL